MKRAIRPRRARAPQRARARLGPARRRRAALSGSRDRGSRPRRILLPGGSRGVRTLSAARMPVSMAPDPRRRSWARSLRSYPPTRRKARDRDGIVDFVRRHADPFDRAIAEGHLTGSAITVSHDGARVLLLHHRKLDRWLQPGGHGDPGETTGEEVALREALEETGIRGLALHPAAPRPLDVDVHDIPARGSEPAHEHLDLRYLVVAPGGRGRRARPGRAARDPLGAVGRGRRRSARPRAAARAREGPDDRRALESASPTKARSRARAQLVEVQKWTATPGCAGATRPARGSTRTRRAGAVRSARADAA